MLCLQIIPIFVYPSIYQRRTGTYLHTNMSTKVFQNQLPEKNSNGKMTQRDGEMVSIKNYFQSILELSQSGDEFPIDLDDVWMLAYSEKSKAVRALGTNDYFVKGLDYRFIAQDGEKSDKGRPVQKCVMTVPCFEYFIARKIRPVFDVYRQVFHKAIKQAVTPKAEPKDYTEDINTKFLAVKWVSDILNLDKTSRIRALNPILKEVGLAEIEYEQDARVSHSATELLKTKGISISTSNFNKTLEKAGLLKNETRYSTKTPSKEKHYWSIPEKYLNYGRNNRHKDNDKETQPYWYDDTFDEVLKLSGIIK